MYASIKAWIDGLGQWMVSFAAADASIWYGGGALFGFSFAESSFFPIPPDLLLVALCLTDRALGAPHLALFYALMCSIASVLGGLFGYLIGLKGGRPLLERLFAEEKIAAVDRAFDRHGAWAVAVAGFTPIPYKVFTIASGAFKLSVWRFTVASVLSRSARFFLVAVGCIIFGEAVRKVLEKRLNLFGIIFVVSLVGGFFIVKLAARRYAARGTPPAPGPGESNGD